MQLSENQDNFHNFCEHIAYKSLVDIWFNLNIMQKLKMAVRAVFTGDATGEQFIEVFFILVPIMLVVVLFFMLR